MSFTPEILLSRLTDFANKCRILTQQLPVNSHNNVYRNQLNRSSSSPGANYIEAINASSSKEFVLRLKISRKELKESDYWLNLIYESNKNNQDITGGVQSLRIEVIQLIKIFTSSIITSEKNNKIRKLSK